MLEALVDGGCREPLASVGIVGGLEELAEELLGGRLVLEPAVVAHEQLRLVLVEPVGLALFEQCLGLGVELLVVGAQRDVDGAGELDADEAPVARGVGEHVGDVGGGDERGQSGEVFYVVSVGSLGLDAGQLDDVFEKSLLGVG